MSEIMEFVPAKTILSTTKCGDDWFGIDYNMNLYRGCSHGCIYCDSRSSCYQVDQFDTVRGKKNEIEILQRELASKKKKGVVGIGSMSDTYNPFEKKYELTRKALDLLNQYRFGVSIDTKSDLILRDIDLLQKINEHSSVIVKMTITAADDALSKKIEPYVCPSSTRFKALEQLHDAGIFAGILMSPVLPMITDSKENIEHLVKLAAAHKVKFIYTYMGMTLRENQRDYYYEQLDRLFPGLKEQYQKYYGNRYGCSSPKAKELYIYFTGLCKEYGILYQMKDIIAAYKKKSKTLEQLSLF